MENYDNLLFSSIQLDSCYYFNNETKLISEINNQLYLNPKLQQCWVGALDYEQPISFEDKNDFLHFKDVVQQNKLIEEFDKQNSACYDQNEYQSDNIATQSVKQNIQTDKFIQYDFLQINLQEPELICVQQLQVDNHFNILLQNKQYTITIENTGAFIYDENEVKYLLFPYLTILENIFFNSDICHIHAENEKFLFNISKHDFILFSAIISNCYYNIDYHQVLLKHQQQYNFITSQIYDFLCYQDLTQLQKYYNDLDKQQQFNFENYILQIKNLNLLVIQTQIKQIDVQQVQFKDQFLIVLMLESGLQIKQAFSLDQFNINLDDLHFQLFIQLLPNLLNLDKLDTFNMPKIYYQILYFIRKLIQDEQFLSFSLLKFEQMNNITLIGQQKNIYTQPLFIELVQILGIPSKNINYMFDQNTKSVQNIKFDHFLEVDHILQYFCYCNNDIMAVAQNLFSGIFPGSPHQNSNQYYKSQQRILRIVQNLQSSSLQKVPLRYFDIQHLILIYEIQIQSIQLGKIQLDIEIKQSDTQCDIQQYSQYIKID